MSDYETFLMYFSVSRLGSEGYRKSCKVMFFTLLCYHHCYNCFPLFRYCLQSGSRGDFYFYKIDSQTLKILIKIRLIHILQFDLSNLSADPKNMTS